MSLQKRAIFSNKFLAMVHFCSIQKPSLLLLLVIFAVYVSALENNPCEPNWDYVGYVPHPGLSQLSITEINTFISASSLILLVL
jgi:hypothetical protein